MPGHVARKVQSGATRNLVVRFANANITAETIREDLEHIHNLNVVDVTLRDGHAFISTNGINWAITAKACMSSRLKYKGTKIAFFHDECDEPLPLPKRQALPLVAMKKTVPNSHVNRFALLLEAGENMS